MKSILFFSRYPFGAAEKSDGEMQRVMIVDKLAQREGFERTYMHLRFRGWRITCARAEDDSAVLAYRLPICNPRSWLLAVKLLKDSSITYFHSLHNYKFASMLWPWLCRTQSVLDLHGVVPEENAFLDQPLRAWAYAMLERHAVRRFKRYVAVSYAMIEHMQGKYGHLPLERFSLLPMIRDGAFPYAASAEAAQRKALGIAADAPVAIYAGNLQKWQNIDPMIELIARCGDRLQVIILSAELDQFRTRLAQHGIHGAHLAHVRPDQLHNYYCVANYGFLLRDDNVVNNVANPTKLVEYLKYGIIPVVLTDKTSDLKLQQADLILAEELAGWPLQARRSQRNLDIFERYYREDNFSLVTIIFGAIPAGHAGPAVAQP